MIKVEESFIDNINSNKILYHRIIDIYDKLNCGKIYTCATYHGFYNYLIDKFIYDRKLDIDLANNLVNLLNSKDESNIIMTTEILINIYKENYEG